MIAWPALAFFFLALAAKSAVATAPAAFLAVMWWKRRRLAREDAILLAPFFGLGLASGLLTSWVEKHHVGAHGGTWALGLVEKSMVAGRVLWFYAAKFLLHYVEEGIVDKDPFVSLDVSGVGKLVEIGVQKGRQTKSTLKIGVCGEHGGDPASIHFFASILIDYVSCSPFRVPVARLETGRAALMVTPRTPGE